jgi:hypothetical protein
VLYFFLQSKKEKAHIIATKRAETILGASAEDAVSAEALFDVITLPVSLTAIKDEDRALRMIFRGFAPPTRSWVRPAALSIPVG